MENENYWPQILEYENESCVCKASAAGKIPDCKNWWWWMYHIPTGTITTNVKLEIWQTYELQYLPETETSTLQINIKYSLLIKLTHQFTLTDTPFSMLLFLLSSLLQLSLLNSNVLSFISLPSKKVRCSIGADHGFGLKRPGCPPPPQMWQRSGQLNTLALVGLKPRVKNVCAQQGLSGIVTPKRWSAPTLDFVSHANLPGWKDLFEVCLKLLMTSTLTAYSVHQGKGTEYPR